jgi:cytochrome c5
MIANSVKRYMVMKWLWVVLMISSLTLYAGVKRPTNSAVKKEIGKEVYEQYCTVCHAQGLVGAPRFRNKQDWNSRLANRTLNDLLASSIKGLNAMPEKGTCLKCTEDELEAALTYMLPKS